MVVYDPESKQLVVRSDNKLELNECPYCHRPLRDEAGSNGAASNTAAANFASPEYFRMLHHSLPGSAESSSPPTPSRRPTRALAGRLSTSSSYSRPPPGAEFVGSSPAPDSGSHGISSSSFSPNYFKRFFIEERELGRGGKGVVLLVRHVLDGVSLGHFALKRIPVGDDHDWLRKVLIEVQLLQHLSHQNLVSYRHVWLEDVQITAFGPSVPCAFVLQQYCNAGDLHQYIYGAKTEDAKSTAEQLKQRLRRLSKHEAEPPKVSGPRRLQLEEIYGFFKDITMGLNHLHVNGYIHRDLKPNNCLLHRSGKDLRVLVSDFGEVQRENQVRKSSGATGTISYCAPEVLRQDPQTGALGNFSTKSDIFSLGMILYFLCFAKLPYRNADNLNEEDEDVDLLKAEIATWTGLEDHRSERADLPDKLHKFLRRLLSLHPANRPSAEDILHALKTGTGLEEPDFPSRSNAATFEDVSGSRISPLDTPPASLSPSPSWSGARPANVRKMTPPRNIKVSSPLARELPTSSSSEGEQDARPTSSSASLVLRSPRSPPLKMGPPSPLPHRRWRAYLRNPETLRVIKVVLFLVKLMSLYVPCMPSAASPSVGLPLLAVATFDLLLLDLSNSLIFLTLHVAVGILAWRSESLCVPRAATLWRDI